MVERGKTFFWCTRALCNHIHGEGADEPSPQELANAINEEYRLPRPLAQIPQEEDSAHHLPVVSE